MKFSKLIIILLIPIIFLSCDNAGKEHITYLEKLGLNLIIQTPENNQSLRPAIIFLHGGAWYLFDKSEMKYMVKHAAANGYIGISADYRLTTVAPWPAQLKDAKTVVRWVKTNAKKYNVDPNKIGIAGHSAGGQISLMTAFTHGMSEYDTYTDEDDAFEGTPYPSVTSDVAAVSTWAAPTDILGFYLETHMNIFVKESNEDIIRMLLYGHDSNESLPIYVYEEEPVDPVHHIYYYKKFLEKGKWYGDYTDIFASMSPFNYVYNNTVPVLLLQGQADIIVYPRTHNKLLSELDKYNCEYEYKLYSKACDHFFNLHKEKLKKDVIEFMDRHLK